MRRRYRRYALVKAEENGYKCSYCGAELTPTTVTGDHVKAQSKGGSDKFANIVPACRRCNGTKGSLPVEVFVSQPSRQNKARRPRRTTKIPPISVWNPRREEWVPIGAQGRSKIPAIIAGGKYLFR